MAYVYILKGKRFYIGSTINLEQRLFQHENDLVYSTKRIGEWKLVRVIETKTIEEAQSLERKIKKSGHPERWLQKEESSPAG